MQHILEDNQAIEIVKVWQLKSKTPPNDKPPLIFLKFKSEEDRNQAIRIFGNSLRKSQLNKSIYIQPDYTRKQRAQLYELRQQVKTRRGFGENVRLKGFRIVPGFAQNKA